MLSAQSPAQVEAVVHAKIRAVMAERGSDIGRLHGAEKLNATLGLSSLDLAFLVAELERELGVDPFAKLVAITSVVSVDDLVRAYQQTLFPELQDARDDNAVVEALNRAQTRRVRRNRR